MADFGGDRVFCHSCGGVWLKENDGDLSCPHCLSEFTEIIEIPPDNQPAETDGNHHTEPINPWADHNPWAQQERRASRSFTFEDMVQGFPQQPFNLNETDPSRQGLPGSPSSPSSPHYSHRTYRSPNGRFTFRSTHISGGAPTREGGPQASPMATMMIQGIDAMFRQLAEPTDLRGQRGAAEMDPFNSHSPAWPEHDHLDIDDDMHHPSLRQQALEEPFARTPPPPPPPQSILDLMEAFRHTGASQYPHTRSGRHGARGVAGPNPFAMLSALLAMEPSGDAVYSQEQFDRVISQLVDQNANGTAPPPASTTSIQNLPKKKVSREMLGSDGSAECSICMDAVELGTEVTVLPCTHWFHYPCIEAWLNQHNTCPHCRRSIDSVPTTGQGTNEDPVVIQDSPGTQSGGGRRRRSSQITPPSGRSSISRSSPSPQSPDAENPSTRRSSRSSRNSREGGRGGPLSWVWSRLGGNTT